MNNLKNTLMITVAFLALFATQSCQKDDNPSPDPEPEETVQKLELEGKWTIESVNFLDESANWDNAVAFTSESGLGWAPNMYGKTMGINFQTTAVNDESNTKLGSKFNFIVGEDLPLSESDTYWYWNYVDEQESFEMKQLATAILPYDFSLSNISDVKTENDGDKIVFQAKINSRKPGGEATETLQVPVEITLRKGAPTEAAAVLLKGHPFVMPELELTEEENQAELIDELKELMGYNSNYTSTQLGSSNPAHIFYYMTTIDEMDWAVLDLENRRDNNNTKFLAPFVCIDKHNTLYFYFANSYTTYTKYHIEKENNLYTIIGEHIDNNLFFSPAYRDMDATARMKITYDVATKETIVVQEMLLDMGGSPMVFLDPVLKWTKDPSITVHSSFDDDYNPFPDLEL